MLEAVQENNFELQAYPIVKNSADFHNKNRTQLHFLISPLTVLQKVGTPVFFIDLDQTGNIGFFSLRREF